MTNPVCKREVREGHIAAYDVRRWVFLSLPGSKWEVGFYFPARRLRRMRAVAASISAGVGS